MSTIRDLRNRFPQVREQLEADGEVLLTERGKPRYRLTLYAEAAPSSPKKNYLERLKRHQPRPMSAAESRALHEDNRGER